jgi:hypothetical protein
VDMLREKEEELQEFKVQLAAQEVELAEISGLPIRFQVQYDALILE